MNARAARLALFVITIAIFVGTLMPGSWKDAALGQVQRHIDAAALAHVCLFAAFAFALRRSFGTVGALVIGAGLALGMLTEGLQHFAIDRHPEWRGVAQDLAGSVLGWVAARWWESRESQRRDQSRPGVSTQR